MANATLTIGGIVGVVLAVPIVGSLLPPKNASAGSWARPERARARRAAKSDRQAGEADVHAQICRRVSPRAIQPGVRLGHQSGPREVSSGAHRHLQSAAARPTFRTTSSTWVSSSSVRSVPISAATTAGTTRRTASCVPCHGSQYTFDGTHIAGPAPRGLDPLPLREQSGTAEVTWIVYQSNTPARIVVSYQA